MAQYFNIVANPSGPLTFEDIQRMCSVEGQSVQFLVEDSNNGLNGAPQLVTYTTATQGGEQAVFTPQTINLSGQLATNILDQRQTVLIENLLIERGNIAQPHNIIRNTVNAQVVGENVANVVENRGSPKIPLNNTSPGQNMQWVKMQENNINFDAVFKQNTLTPIKNQVCNPMRNQAQANIQPQVTINPQGQQRAQSEQPMLLQGAKKVPIKLYHNKNRQQLASNTTVAAVAATSSCPQVGRNVVNSNDERLINSNMVNNRNSNTVFRSKPFGQSGPEVSKTPIRQIRNIIPPDATISRNLSTVQLPKNPLIRKPPELEYLSEKIKQAKLKQIPKSQMVVSPQFQRPILQQNQQQRQQQMGTNITPQQRQQLVAASQHQKQGQAISNSPVPRNQITPNTSQQRQPQLVLTPQQHAQLQRQPMMMTPQQKQQHQVQVTPVQQLMEVDTPENVQDNSKLTQQSCASRTDNDSGSSHSLAYYHKTIDNPQTCIVQRQIESNTAKMLVILQNGEQRLITFDIPNEDCTVQDLLEQAKIPFCAETTVSLVTDPTLHINYVVEAGPGTFSYSGDCSEQSDSNPSLDKIVASPEGSSPVFSPSEENSNSSMTQQEEAKYVEGKLAVCSHCGLSSIDFNRCQRCKRPLPDNVKTVPMNMGMQAKKENMLAVDTFYKKSKEQHMPLKIEREPPRRGRGRGRPPTNKTRLIKEPECLTISSDEDDQGEGKSKKSELGSSNNMLTHIGHIRHQPEMEMISDKEPVITNNSVSNVMERHIDEGIRVFHFPGGGGRENEFQNIPDGSIQAPQTSLICRTVRIGSYKYIPQEKIIISQSGVRLGVPLLEDGTNFVPLEVKFKDLVKVLIHFGKAMPVLFFYTTANAGSMIRELLGMQDPKGPYYDPAGKDHTHRRITLLPDRIEEDTKLVLKALFAHNNLFEELNSKEANDILVRASPKDSWQVQSLIKSSGLNSSVLNNSTNGGIQTIMVYPPPPAKGGIAINTEDYACLGEDQFLNDVIIDFYLKYLTLEVLSEEDQNRTHVFSSYFYKRLTSPHASAAESSTPLSAAAKRHARVQKWTKNVNIFEKDFIVIPINEHAHWFLAIICFPGFVGKVPISPPVVKENEVKKPVTKSKKVKEMKLQPVTIGNTTITPVTATITLDPADEGSERDEAEGDDEEMEMDSDEEEESEGGEQAAKTPQKPATPIPAEKESVNLPCILIFDSLAGASRVRVVATLRDYLSCEYLAKMGTEKLFSKDTIKGACPKVPQQSNFTDCGVYLLQYVESFFNDPIKNYTLPIKTLKQWFDEIIVTRKREELSKLLVRLMNATKGDRNIILPVLTFPTHEGRLLPKPESNVEMKAIKSDGDNKKKSTSEMETRSCISGSTGTEENTEAVTSASHILSQSPPSSSNANDNSQTEIAVDGKTLRSSSETMSYLKAKRIPRLMQRTSESQDDKLTAKKHKGETFDSCK